MNRRKIEKSTDWRSLVPKNFILSIYKKSFLRLRLSTDNRWSVSCCHGFETFAQMTLARTTEFCQTMRKNKEESLLGTPRGKPSLIKFFLKPNTELIKIITLENK